MFTAKPSLVHLDARLAEPELSDFHCNRKKLQLGLLAGLAHEVVQRLAYEQRQPDAVPPGPSAEDLENLCAALIEAEDASAAEDVINELAERNSPEEVYSTYLAAAARMLGDWWLEDRASFVEVTVGTGRIIEILRSSSHLFAPVASPQDMTIVFASVPGEQHTLGIHMAADLFRGDGWEIALKIGLGREELVAEIEKLPRCIVGLSIGGRHSLEALTKLVAALHARCPHALLVVSGQDIDEIKPQLARMELDGIAGELNEAKVKISELWDREMMRQKFDFAEPAVCQNSETRNSQTGS